MGCALSAAAAPALSSAAARFSARLRKASWTAFFRTFASSAPFASLDAANGNGAGGGAARRKGGVWGGIQTKVVFVGADDGYGDIVQIRRTAVVKHVLTTLACVPKIGNAKISAIIGLWRYTAVADGVAADIKEINFWNCCHYRHPTQAPD